MPPVLRRSAADTETEQPRGGAAVARTHAEEPLQDPLGGGDQLQDAFESTDSLRDRLIHDDEPPSAGGDDGDAQRSGVSSEPLPDGQAGATASEAPADVAPEVEEEETKEESVSAEDTLDGTSSAAGDDGAAGGGGAGSPSGGGEGGSGPERPPGEGGGGGGGVAGGAAPGIASDADAGAPFEPTVQVSAPPEIDEVGVGPAPVSGPLQGVASTFYSAATAERARVVSEVSSGRSRLSAAADEARTTALDAIQGARATLEASQSARLAEIEAQRAQQVGEIEARRIEVQASLDDAWGSASDRLDESFDARKASLLDHGTSAAAEIRAHGDTTAAWVEAQSDANAQRAVQIGEESANKNANAERNADEIASMAREASAEMASELRRNGSTSASQIREKAASAAQDVQSAVTDGLTSLEEQRGSARADLRELYDAAYSKVVAPCDQAKGQVEEAADVAAQALETIYQGAYAELDRLEDAIDPALDAAVSSGEAALVDAATPFLEDYDAIVAEVQEALETAEGADPALIEPELEATVQDLTDGANAAIAEMDRAAGDMERDIRGIAEAAVQGVDEVCAAVDEQAGSVVAELEQQLGVVATDMASALDGLLTTTSSASDSCISSLDKELEGIVADAQGEIDSTRSEVVDEIDDVASSCVDPQQQALTELAARIDAKAVDLQRNILVRIVLGVAGFVWGIVKTLLVLVVTLVVAIVAIVALVVLLIGLGLLLTVVFGEVIAAAVVIVLAVVLIAVIVVVLIAGIVLTVEKIVQNVIRLVTDETLTWFDTGFLIGETITEILQLLLPLKAKIKVRLGRLGRFIRRVFRAKEPKPTLPKPNEATPKVPPLGEKPPTTSPPASGKEPPRAGGVEPTPIPKPYSRADAARLLAESEGRQGLGTNVGHTYDHIPRSGQDPMALAAMRPTNRNTTVWRSASHAERALRDVLNANQAAIDNLAPGQSINGPQSLRELRPGYNGFYATPSTPVVITEVQIGKVTWRICRLPTGELHLMHFSPKL
jgi:molybdenum-dependent DNA-binding transcriptional regulator ModE